MIWRERVRFIVTDDATAQGCLEGALGWLAFCALALGVGFDADRVALLLVFGGLIVLGGMLSRLLHLILKPMKQSWAMRQSAKGSFGKRKGCRLVFLLVPARNREYVEGDLEEQYCEEIVCKYGRFRARCWWWKQVVGVIGPYLWKRIRRALGLDDFRKFLR